MIDAKVFLGLSKDFQNLFSIYPPTVEDVLKSDDFFKYVQILTISQEEVEDIFFSENDKNPNSFSAEKIPTPLEFLLINANSSKEYEELAEKAFEFFLKQKVSFLYKAKSILIGDIEQQIETAQSLDELTLLDESNYFAFQNLIREVLGEKTIDPPDPNLHPKIKAMKAKARYRDKVKAKQGGGISLGTSLAAICCMDMGLNPLNVGKISYASISSLTRLFQNKEGYSTDISSLLAGADPKKIKIKYWIRED